MIMMKKKSRIQIIVWQIQYFICFKQNLKFSTHKFSNFHLFLSRDFPNVKYPLTFLNSLKLRKSNYFTSLILSKDFASNFRIDSTSLSNWRFKLKKKFHSKGLELAAEKKIVHISLNMEWKLNSGKSEKC